LPTDGPHHGVRLIVGCLCEMLSASSLDLTNLITDKPPARHVAT